MFREINGFSERRYGQWLKPRSRVERSGRLAVLDSARYLGMSPRIVEAHVAAGLVVPVRLLSPRGGRYLGRVLLVRASLDELVANGRGRR